MRKYTKLLHYAFPYRPFFLLIFALTLATSVLVALKPWPMKILIDHVLGTVPPPEFLKMLFLMKQSANPTPTLFLSIAVLGGLVLFALNSIVDVGLTWGWTIAERRMVRDLAQDLFARLQRRSLLFHSRNRVGDLLCRVTGDSWCLHQIIDSFFFSPAQALLTIAGMVFLMWCMDPQLTLLSLCVAPLMVGTSFWLGKRIRAAAKLKREIESNIQSHIHETLTGIPVVQAFVQEERETSRFRTFADAAIQAQQKTTFISSINSLGSGLAATLGTGIVLWAGAHKIINGQLTIGSVLVFLVYLNSLQTQLKILAGLYPTLQGARAGIDRVCFILDAEPEITEKPNAVGLRTTEGHVQLRNVTFGYEAGCPVFQNVSLEVRPGETLAIVGPTGAGKSTLVSLIPRFIDPWSGCVQVNGFDVRDLRLRSLRSQIALVLQEPFLFPISLAENIAYGRPNASRQEIEAAARAANAQEFIERLPRGFDTVIGERGATLSGGERQRLSIARAILKNAPILILDEPTSALDAETEHSILEALNRLMRDRTVIVIAHRLSTVKDADRIVVLKDGLIEETGTHYELLGRSGTYTHFYERQFNITRQTARAG